MNRKDLRTDLAAHVKQYPSSAKAQAVAKHGMETAVDREIMFDLMDGLNQMKLTNYPKHPELKALLMNARESTKIALDALQEQFWS